MATLERAVAIAAEAHAGQVDKAGTPYLLHPLRVMLACRAPEERIVAVLHDVVEDTPWTFERLRAEGFSETVLEGLESVTKRPEEESDYMAFVRRASRHPIGRRVKMADLHDNSDVSRIANPTPKDFARLERYQHAIEYLLTAD